jgi:uncharacterized protein YjiS (DUF1127 family)
MAFAVSAPQRFLIPSRPQPWRRRLPQWLVRPGHAIAREWRLRRAIRALRELDPRLLADIGLKAAAIESAVRKGRRY